MCLPRFNGVFWTEIHHGSDFFSRGFGFGTNFLSKLACLKTSLRRWQSVGELGGEIAKMRVGKLKNETDKKIGTKGVFTKKKGDQLLAFSLKLPSWMLFVLVAEVAFLEFCSTKSPTKSWAVSHVCSTIFPVLVGLKPLPTTLHPWIPRSIWKVQLHLSEAGECF